MEGGWKSCVLWTFIVGLCFVGIPIHLKGQDQLMLEKAFDNFTETYNKTYDRVQRKGKLERFKICLDHINKLNTEAGILTATLQGAGGIGVERESKDHHRHKQWQPGAPKHEGTARWGVTKFADMTPEEFQSKLLDQSMSDRIKLRQTKEQEMKENLIVRKKRAVVDYTGLPAKVDWRTKGVLTPIKHQQNCGACWAFSTVEAVESMNAIQNGMLKRLSVQQVIDCAKNGNMGCSGGDTCAALSWMTKTKLASETEYPTTLMDGKCKLLAAPAGGVEVAMNFTCENLILQEKKILSYIANHGPVVAAVDATNWQFYVGGIIQWNCDANVNHAVQIVGYDSTGNPPYYIVRNSWGPDYGDNGYLYVGIGSNLCGIAREVSVVTVK